MPQLILSCTHGGEIALVSPWIHDVPLDLPPPLGNAGGTLSELLDYAQRERRLRVIIYCRERDQYIRRILIKLSDQVELLLRPNLHAKAIVTSRFILSGSANLLWTSLYRNDETLRLDCNQRTSVRQALRQDLNIS